MIPSKFLFNNQIPQLKVSPSIFCSYKIKSSSFTSNHTNTNFHISITNLTTQKSIKQYKRNQTKSIISTTKKLHPQYSQQKQNPQRQSQLPLPSQAHQVTPKMQKQHPEQQQHMTPSNIDRNTNIEKNKAFEFLSEENPLHDYNEDIFDQILTTKKKQRAQKSPQSSSVQKSEQKPMKRRQKIQNLTTQYQTNPELNKQRNKQRHQKQKEKLFKQLQGLTQQEKRHLLNQKRKNRSELNQKAKQFLEEEKGLPFIIDVAFEHRMDDKENKSLAIQIDLIVKAIKKMEHPANIYVAGNKGKVKKQLERMQYQYWPLKCYEEGLEECLKKQPRFCEPIKNVSEVGGEDNNKKENKLKNIYYLSPDSPHTLETFNKNQDIFIIGGLVDRTVIKNASLNRAQELGIKAVSLPIKPYMKQRNCLNLDHIVTIMCKFAECGNWKEAFYYGAPKRWKKDEKDIKEKKESGSDLEGSEDENEEKSENSREQVKDKKQ